MKITSTLVILLFYLNLVGYKVKGDDKVLRLNRFYLNLVGYKGFSDGVRLFRRTVLSELSGI